jgi:biotin carboxylase
MPDRAVLVVGTTPDYIDWIRTHYPGRALFVTDRAARMRATEPAPAERDEVLTDLTRPEQVLGDVRRHLAHWNLSPAGITCYDCESMLLAAELALTFSLSYPGPDAIRACRSKLLAKQLWRNAGVTCPAAALVENAADAVRFLAAAGGAAVLKPLSGSGSELVFICRSTEECRTAFATIAERLPASRNRRMYARESVGDASPDPQRAFVMEEYVAGPEYSCDFILEPEGVRIVRIARKLMARDASPGTTLAYEIPAQLPAGLPIEHLQAQLAAGARSLGLQRAIVMTDFILRDARAYLIEMTPRPGGDCLPPLIRQSCGLDMLGAALDFAAGERIAIPPPDRWQPRVGLRIIARQAGTLEGIDDRLLKNDARVQECVCTVSPGHRVSLPPLDYDSRILGYVIFTPASPESIERESLELAGLIAIHLRDATRGDVPAGDPGPTEGSEGHGEGSQEA